MDELSHKVAINDLQARIKVLEDSQNELQKQIHELRDLIPATEHRLRQYVDYMVNKDKVTAQVKALAKRSENN